MSYKTSDVYVMKQIDHIRNSTGMYIGSTERSTRLVEELLDNALDEVQAGFCKIVGVFIDTKNNIIKVLDSGRGIPFDDKLPYEKDPPIMIATKLFSSGKFNKGENDSAYQIAAGLHGVGTVAVNALSDWMEIEIYRGKKHAIYKFKDATTEITRTVEKHKLKSIPFSTKVTIKPSDKYFIDSSVDVDVIEERLRIACVNFPDLKAVLRVDGEDKIIKGSEQELILSYLTDEEELDWIEFDIKKGVESCYLKLTWGEKPPTATKVLSCVNLVRVHSGSHINTLFNAIKNTFVYLAKKYKYEFKPEDCLTFLRCYFDLKIIKTSFEAQVKVRLESKSDLSIMDPLESKIKKYLEDNNELRTRLLEKFQDYRKLLKSRKLKSTGKKHTTKNFTKLRDCKNLGGELLIGEGDSAIGGLVEVRDRKKHAILPLRGVITNVLKKKLNWLENIEVREIIQSLGTGTENDCDVSKLRYSKIILAADADPAGKFITTLLIILFAKLTPDIIKAGKLYVCRTPLYGTRENNKLVPIWTETELEQARKNNLHIKRFKGLGEFNPKDLKVFTLDVKTRKLIQVKWSDNYEKLFKLMVSSSERRKLVLGEWTINN